MALKLIDRSMPHNSFPLSFCDPKRKRKLTPSNCHQDHGNSSYILLVCRRGQNNRSSWMSYYNVILSCYENLIKSIQPIRLNMGSTWNIKLLCQTRLYVKLHSSKMEKLRGKIKSCWIDGTYTPPHYSLMTLTLY